MSTYDKYVGTPTGRTFMISGVIVLVLAYIAVIIPLATYDETAWYSFLYFDVTLPAEERMNWGLMILEGVILMFFYLFLMISLGSYAEINNRLPSWGEIFVAVIVTLTLSYLLPQISVGTVAVAEGSGFKHFTPDMQLGVFLITVFGIILMTLYMFYTGEEQE